MKTKLVALILLTGLFLPSKVLCQSQNVKNDTLTILLNDSKIKDKKLFLVFGWEGCGWCRVFDKYHNDTLVKTILNKYFIITKIDIYKTKTGEDLYKRFGKAGTPSWSIFDLKGQVIIDSDNGQGNIGFPAKDAELEYYIIALKKAVPNLSPAESELLVTKLKEYRNKKDLNEL